MNNASKNKEISKDKEHVKESISNEEIKLEKNDKNKTTNKKENVSKKTEVTNKENIVEDIPIPVKESDSDRSVRLRKEEEAEERKKNSKKQLSLGREFGQRRQKKLSINQSFDEEDRQRSLASVRRAREREKRNNAIAAGGGGDSTKKIVREVTVPEIITVQELANRMAIRSGDVVKSLMKNGVLATATQNIDGDTAELVVIEFGHTVKRVSDADVEIGLEIKDDSSEGVKRPPVVTVMGHVDHGKTSLLDAIRSTDVVSRESGGITQHIGAYQIENKESDLITFIDTPGHAAFSAMRARGANITDIVVLVVAADDSVMPQTIEAIQHALAAKAPIVLAINKIDTPGANPSKVKQDLLQHNIITEELGGEVVSVEVSALKKTNIDELISTINLQAEILDLKAVRNGVSSGIVIESRVDTGRGVVATLLVSRGELKIGDIIVAGQNWGKIRALLDHNSKNKSRAYPSDPVEILGLNSAPQAGDIFTVVENESRAREVTEYRKQVSQKNNIAGLKSSATNLDQMLSEIKQGERKIMPIVLKTDVNGSMEAISSAIKDLENDEIVPQIILAGVGSINESDIMLSVSSNAVVIGFNVRADSAAKKLSEKEGIEVLYYSIIYDLIDGIKVAIEGHLKPDVKEEILGTAEVKDLFKSPKFGLIAGSIVIEGTIKRNKPIRVLRDDIVIFEGELDSLKRFKDDASEVPMGTECGIGVSNYKDVQIGDKIEVFDRIEVKRTLD